MCALLHLNQIHLNYFLIHYITTICSILADKVITVLESGEGASRTTPHIAKKTLSELLREAQENPEIRIIPSMAKEPLDISSNQTPATTQLHTVVILSQIPSSPPTLSQLLREAADASAKPSSPEPPVIL